MSNMLVDVITHLDIPESAVEDIVGLVDDGSDGWHEAAYDAVQQAVSEDPVQFMVYAVGEDVEVTA